METGGPAFAAGGHPGQQHIQQEGMTIRDYLASASLQGWLASYGEGDRHPVLNETADQVACLSYAMADAMLKSRSAHN